MKSKNRPRRSSPLNLPSAFDLFKPSRDLFINHLEIFGPLYVLPLIFWFHSWASTPAGAGHYWARLTDTNYGMSAFPTAFVTAFIGISMLWLLISFGLGSLVQIMAQDAQLKAVDKQAVTFNKVWATAKQMWHPMIKLYIVLGLIIGIGFLIIIPGLMLLRRYMFAPYVMLEKKCSIPEAMSGSAKLSNINPGSVWSLIGVMILIAIVGIIPFIGSVAAFVLGGMYSIAPALRYKQLKNLA